LGSELGEDKKKYDIELLESLIENGLYEESLSFINRSIAKYTDISLKYLKGKVYYLMGKFDESIAELSSVIAEDSDYWEAYELLGEIYRIRNQTEIAENYYFKSTSLNPRATQSWLGRGKLAMARGEFQVAVLSFETYLRTKREDIEVWKLLGRSYKELENFVSAVDAYNDAIELEPTNQELYEELGDLYLFMGHEDVAKDKYLQAMQVEEKTRPVNAKIYNKLSRLYLAEGNIQKAFNMCNELLTLSKNNDEALFLSGKALIKMGQRYEGTVRIKRALEISGKSEYKDFLNKLDNELYGPKYV
jgi:Flp pilus assembly protein TadD